jgi:hypothetical protein
MISSDQINELAAALTKAQGQLSHAVKDSINPHFKAKYADLASVWEACRKALVDNGLSVIQLPEPCENGLKLTTMLTHLSGQYIASTLQMPLTKSDPQGYGSALTYARRYSLAAIVGVYQDDDDANTATQTQHTQQPIQTPAQPTNNAQTATQTPTQPTREMITDQQISAALNKAGELGLTRSDLSLIIKFKFRADNSKQLTKKQGGLLIGQMETIWEEYLASGASQIAATQAEE